MNRDLFLSILALDSYNRGYGRRLKVGKDAPLTAAGDLGVKLGTATITAQSDTLTNTDGVKADFYAIAYDYNGQTIISYRGTDNLLKDAVNGYGVGAGFSGGPLARQADLAIQFYTSVTGRPAFYLTPPNAVAVGHSLGGGLAGLVSMWTGIEGHGYDHMPFVQAAINGSVDRILKGENSADFTKLLQLISNVIPEYGGVASKLIQLARTGAATPEGFAAQGLLYPTSSNFLGEAVEEELLTHVRDGTLQGLGGTALAGLTALIPIIGPVIAAAIYGFAQSQQITTSILESAVSRKAPYSTFGAIDGVTELVKRHSQALLIILKYVEVEGVDAAWEEAAKYVLPALYEDKIGELLGRTVSVEGQTGGDGLYALNDQLKAAIAYSAIDEGERPFGDQGIKAFFDDAVDLGKALGLANVSQAFVGGSDNIGQIVAQYAGRLAFADVEDGAYGSGVLDLNADKTALSIDVSKASWDAGKAHQEMEIIGLSRLVRELSGDVGFPINVYGPFGGGADGIEWNSPVRAGSMWLYGVDRPSKITGRVTIQTTNAAFDGQVPVGARALAANELALFALGAGNDKVRGWIDNDFLIGGKGNDELLGGGGNDLLVGGEGDDGFAGGTGKNFFIGGAGNDRVDLRLDEPTEGVVAAFVAVASAGNDRKTDIEFATIGRRTGVLTENRATEVETYILTAKADWLRTSSSDLADYVQGYVDPFGTTITVDLSNAATGNISSADFDTVEYVSSDGNGVFWYDGGSHTTGGILASIAGALTYSLAYVAGPAGAVALRLGMAAEGLLPDDNLAIKGAENIILTDKNDRFGFTNNDYTVHSGYGTISGGAGGDILLYDDAKFIEAGAPATPGGAAAAEDLQLTLDGGTGNDWIYASGGEKAVTAGGLGRDWIFNTSPNGIIWGDVANSSKDLSTGDWFYYEARTNADGVEEQVRVDVIDNKTNSDNIWYWADTTLMDAGHSDVLKYFGIPMTGGDANGGLAGYAIYNGLFGAAIGMANIARYFTGQANDWTGEIYVDHIQPWILYSFKADEEGYLDLYITNAFEQIFDGLNAALDLGQQDATPKIHKGWMKIENVDVVGSRLGILQQEAANTVLSNGKKGGSLNMVFRAVNPLQALLPLYDLVPGIIGQALKYSVMADALVGTMSAMGRFLKSMAWAANSDPLVIDLDGDGIETTGVGTSSAYFDVDGDLFAERTGWLKGDDGFLVLDANGNARIDDISEMFGNRAQGGYDELAGYDSNGDGKITVADLVWSELKVWQDRDRDGETDAGELKSLSALGITEFSLASKVLGAMTPQGARLLSYGSVRFDTGRMSTMFEAIFNSNDTVTKFAGESGRAPWQGASTLNAKGFGTITDLAVASANDVGLAELAQSRAAAMVTPKLKTLVAQAGDVLGRWGMSLQRLRACSPGGRTKRVARELMRGRRVAAANDNQEGAWRKATFILAIAA